MGHSLTGVVDGTSPISQASERAWDLDRGWDRNRGLIWGCEVHGRDAGSRLCRGLYGLYD